MSKTDFNDPLHNSGQIGSNISLADIKLDDDGAPLQHNVRTFSHSAIRFIHHSEAQLVSPRTFVSNADVPLLQYPEGITSWDGRVFVGTYNFVNPGDSRIFVFNSQTG